MRYILPVHKCSVVLSHWQKLNTGPFVVFLHTGQTKRSVTIQVGEANGEVDFLVGAGERCGRYCFLTETLQGRMNKAVCL